MVPEPLGAAPEREPRPGRRLRPAQIAAGLGAMLMVWSLAGAPASIGQEVQVEEPDLAAYSTFADAMPAQLYFDHQARLVPLGPALAHSQSEVSLPSQASAIAWLVDNGIANGVHGTSTGTRVPTEASAKQPGGAESDEFKAAGGPIGDDSFASVRAGRASAEARRSNEPRGYANAFFGNLSILPAAGGEMDPPGTYDPDARFPGGDADETDPNPRGQMSIVSVGHIASTSESVREEDTVRSIGVAEIKDLNIGNRTSDGRCTNCIRIDKIRAEAFAEVNGKPGAGSAGYRVTIGRACRRGFNAETGTEEDRCLPLDVRDARGSRGLQEVREVEALNRHLDEPIWTQITDGAVTYTVGVRVHVGSPHRDDSRSERTSSPPEDPTRNYSAISKDGEEATAVAEALDIEISTITSSQVAGDADARLRGTPAQALLSAIDQDDDADGIQIVAPGTGSISIPTSQVRGVRRLHLALGVARASAVARPLDAPPVDVLPADGGRFSPGMTSPEPFVAAPPAPVGGQPGGMLEVIPPPASAPQGGTSIAGGAFRLRINWAAVRIKPWPPYDTAKALASLGLIGSAVWMLRRRFAG